MAALTVGLPKKSTDNKQGLTVALLPPDEIDCSGKRGIRVKVNTWSWALTCAGSVVVAAPSEARFLQRDPVGYTDQINLYAYVANDPVNKTDPSGQIMLPPENIDPNRDWSTRTANTIGNAVHGSVRVEGGTPQQQSQMQQVRDRVLDTSRGQEMRRAAETSLRQEKIVITTEKTANGNPSTGVARIDPNFAPTVATTAGPQKASQEAIVGHELGHSVMGDRDNGPGKMNNVIRNENPIRRELDQPDRTKY